MRATLDFYAYAESDLSDAIILYDAGSYPSSIYHLQQSVEKLAKAYSIVNDIIPFEGFKSKIGHHPHKVFRKQAQNFKEKVDKAVILKDVFPEFFNFQENHNVDWKEYQKSVTKSTKIIQHLDTWDFHELTNREIDFFLGEVRKIEGWTLNIDKEKFLRGVPEKIKSYTNGIKKYDSKEINELVLQSENPEFLNIVGKIALYQTELIPSATSLCYSLLILSLITSSHEETTRYPCGECGYNPREYYIKELEIVDRFPEIMGWHKNIMKNFKILFLETPKIF